jgi:YD repeat-containing protein
MQYVDGLGRPIQAQSNSENGPIVSVQNYDYAGRPSRKYRPYRLQGATSVRDLAFDPYWERNVADAHGSDYAFSRTTYERSPHARPVEITPALENTEYDEENNEAIVFTAFSYGVESLTTLGLSGTYAYEEVTDADGRTTRSYTDGLGRNVLTVADPASSDPAQTRFHYDDRDNLVKVTKPEGDKVEYRYDAAGRLIERISPDAGRSRMLHDDAGRLVYSQSANQRVAGTVSYSTYDAEDRPVATGVAAAEWSQLDANAPVAFDSDTNTLQSIRAYDAKPSGATWPWSLVDWSGLSLDNPFGKVVATAHRVTPPDVDHLSGDDATGHIHKVAQTSITAGDVVIPDGVRVTLEAGESVTLGPGFTIESGANATIQTDPGLDEPGADWRISAFSHDREGRVKAKYVFAPGLVRQTFRYAYDLQGRVISKHVTVGEGGTATHFYQRFEYLPSGNLGAVYASPTDPNPTVPEVRFVYAPDGQLKRTLYRNTRPVDHEHTVRGWLKRIGDLDTKAAPFNATYTYTKSGNVESVQVRHGTNDTFRQHTYTYSYDRFGRIWGADFSSPDLLAGSEEAGAYDVSGITYDKNGNIRSLVRNGPSGTPIDDLVYDYATSSGRPNRLMNVGDGSPANLGWDAQTGDFAYDASGNAVQLPDPYGVSSTVYNTANLPTRVEGSGTDVTYRYSSDGQRTYTKVKGQPERHFIRDGAALVAEFQNGQLSHWNVLDPRGRVLGRIVP